MEHTLDGLTLHSPTSLNESLSHHHYSHVPFILSHCFTNVAALPTLIIQDIQKLVGDEHVQLAALSVMV
jgi:hypothetical protein